MTTPLKHLGKTVRWFAAPQRTETPVSVSFRIVSLTAVAFWLVITGWIVTRTIIVGSPDEAANAVFISRLSESGQYTIPTSFSAAELSYLHPRSFAILNQSLAPGSFLGLVQLGGITAALAGQGAEKMLTPLLSLGGLFAMFFVFRRFWGRWWSLLGVIFIATHPVFFEFATLPYLHNGVFTAGLLLAGWGLLRVLERPTVSSAVVFGFLLGLALYFRPIEVIWTVPLVVVLLCARRLWVPLFIVGGVVLMVQIPWLITNRAIFGSWLSSGYTPTGVFTEADSITSVAAPAKTLFTPAGGHWSWHWLSSMWWYYVLFLPTWSMMAFVSLVKYFRRKFVSRGKIVKLTIVCLLGLFPFVYYGSWDLYPTIPASVNGALASYARYWTVLYLAMTPGVIIVLRALRHRLLILTVTTVMLASQLVIIWSHPVAGVQSRFAADRKYRIVRTAILQATESESVVIAGHIDKYIQDQRIATFALPATPDQWQLLVSVVKRHPVYLYAAFGQYQLDVVQEELSAHHLQLAPRTTIGRDMLFTILPV